MYIHIFTPYTILLCMVVLESRHLTPQMAETRVYLFWNKDKTTDCDRVLLSSDTITTSLHWDTSRNHYATNGNMATGTHSGMLIGNDFEAVSVEPFVVVPSATCLYIQIRTELPLCATSVPLDTSKPVLSPRTDSSLPLSPLDFSCSSDYYDHLIDEDYYKVPKDLLRRGIYQIPSNLLVHQIETGTITQSADSVPTCKQNGTETNPQKEKTPIFQARHPRSHSTAEILESGSPSESHPALSSQTKSSLPMDCTPSGHKTPVAAPRPRKVKEGLDISVEIPDHYDTVKSNQAVKKQLSEYGTCTTEPNGLLSPVRPLDKMESTPLRPLDRIDSTPLRPLDKMESTPLRPLDKMESTPLRPLDKMDSTPLRPLDKMDSSPLRPLRHISPKRPLTSGPILSDPLVSKECSPLSQHKIFSQLSVTHSPSEDSSHPSLSPGVSSLPQEEPSPVIERVKSVPEVAATQSEDNSRLKAEIKSLKKQLSELKIEHSKALGGEVCVRQRLELELKNGKQEVVRVKCLLEEVTKELETTSVLLKEEKETSQNLRCEVMELKVKSPEKPKILKKPILPKPTK